MGPSDFRFDDSLEATQRRKAPKWESFIVGEKRRVYNLRPD